MPGSEHWPLGVAALVFASAAAVIAVCGVLLAERAEALAARTGLGQALLGALFLGSVTSLAGTVASVSAALEGFPEIAFGNAVGGIAAQTTFIVAADAMHRGSNLEHAAASEANLLQGVLLVALLSLPMIGIFWPPLMLGWLDAVSLGIVGLYAFGVRLIAHAQRAPMWTPRGPVQSEARTRRAPRDTRSTAVLWTQFAALAAAVALSGWAIAESAVSLSLASGISQTVVGTVFTAVSTSMPELVIALAAVRRGALNLAMGNILGGNCFDVLFLAASDAAYRGGSLYHAISPAQAGWLALGILLNAVLLLGMLRRQRHGPGNIGFEGVLVLALYAAGIALLFAVRS